MAKLSVIIPARGERFLAQTIDDLFNKASGEIEIIAVLDGYWPDPPLPDRTGLTLIHRGAPNGMRAAINAAAGIAKGEYLMKTDAHCMFDQGFDEKLKSDCDIDWVAIPSRYSLDAEHWDILQTGKSRVDYHYLSCPITGLKERGDYTMHGVQWNERARQRRDKPEYVIDDEMSFQGSCWFMSKRHFIEFLGGMNETGYGTFSQEPQEIGNKTWLGGGRVVVNKSTWYAHLHKGKQYGRGYGISQREIAAGHEYSAVYWMSNQWTRRVHDLEWLIDKFWPVPDWPVNWKEIHAQGFGPHHCAE